MFVLGKVGETYVILLPNSIETLCRFNRDKFWFTCDYFIPKSIAHLCLSWRILTDLLFIASTFCLSSTTTFFHFVLPLAFLLQVFLPSLFSSSFLTESIFIASTILPEILTEICIFYSFITKILFNFHELADVDLALGTVREVRVFWTSWFQSLLKRLLHECVFLTLVIITSIKCCLC